MTETTEPMSGPAAPRGGMSTQDSARFITTTTSTGTTWARSPRGSVMYMPSGCLAASTTTLATLATSSVIGSSNFPSDRNGVTHGVTTSRARPRPAPRPTKAPAARKGDSIRPWARALAKWGHIAMPVTATVWVSRPNNCWASWYCARAWPTPRWDRSRRSVWKAMGMTRDCRSEGAAVSMILTPRARRSRGTSRSASPSRGPVARQATTMQMIETNVLAT